MVLQREGIVSEVETVEAITDVLPVDKVFGMEDNKARYGVHRRAGEIVVIAYSEDVGVGELVVEQRIGERAVTIVSRPRPLQGGSTKRCHQHGHHQ